MKKQSTYLFKTVLVVTGLLMFNVQLYSMGAPGDDCSLADPLTPGTQQCGTNSSAGSFDDASGAPQNPCNSLYNDGEYWYSYTGTGQALQLDVSSLSATYSGLYVLDACPSGGPTCVASYSSGSSTANFTVTTPALTNGNTYYIVIANWSSPYQTNYCLDATSVSPPVPPANDECSGAYAVTVNPSNICTSVTSGTIDLATASAQNTASCGGTEDDDVWFSFVATGPSHYIDLINISGGTTDLYHSVWSGTCPTLTVVAGSCSDPNSSTVTGLTPGNTYYVRVYSWTSTAGQTTNFDICIGTPPPPPANDDCSGAVALTVNPDQLCGTVTTSTIASATPSSQSTTACGGTEDDDVWFSFTATSSQHYIDLLNITGGTTDLYHSVWSGTCPTLNLVAGSCSDPNSSTVTGLTPGNTYYVRVYSWTSTSGQTSVFDICIGSDPAPTCSDGIQNQGETGVDCGGPCPACPPPSCVDGIQNQGELGIDCGGPCPACPPTLIPTACGNVTQTLTTLSSITFYDDGGPGGDPCADVAGTGNYCNCGCFTTTTICAAPGEYIVADFREFAMWNTTSGWDWMKIYDNNNASGTILYDNSSTGPDNPFGDCGINNTPMTFCSSGQCLTFEFWATTVVNRAGWDALVTSVAVPCVLPIELLSFDGQSFVGYNELQWITSSEVNNDYFVLEASATGTAPFIEIARVDGAGNSSVELSYNYTDLNPLASTTFYRLKQVDFDGEYSYSYLVSLSSKGGDETVIYPNPSSGQLFFDISNGRDEVYTIIYSNVLGSTIVEKIQIKKGLNTYEANDFYKLNAGIYFVQVLNENGEMIKSQKIVKE
jgi:hypothetical protein